MQINQNPSTINYEPSRHAENPVEDPAYRDSTMKVEGYVSREKIDKPNDFKQAVSVTVHSLKKSKTT